MDREPPISNLVLAGRMQPPLSSWSEGRAKNAIIDFVERVTCKGSPHYVRRPERIAVFDTDGTLWPERPVYIQAAFAIDRIKLLATQHAKWTEAPLAQAIIAGDIEKLSTASERRTQEILAWTHAGLSADNFEKIIVSWLLTAKHAT